MWLTKEGYGPSNGSGEEGQNAEGGHRPPKRIPCGHRQNDVSEDSSSTSIDDAPLAVSRELAPCSLQRTDLYERGDGGGFGTNLPHPLQCVHALAMGSGA